MYETLAKRLFVSVFDACVFVKLFGSMDVSSKKGCSLLKSGEKTTDRRERFDARVSRDDDDDDAFLLHHSDEGNIERIHEQQ